MNELLQVFTHASAESAARFLKFLNLTLPNVNTGESSSHLKDEIGHWAKSVLNASERNLLNANCERIHGMTDDLGYQALLAEAEVNGEGRGHSNRYDLAILLFVRYPKAFRHGEDIRYANHYREGRSWSCYRTALPAAFSDLVPRGQFENLLKRHFDLGDEDDLLVDVFPRKETGNEEVEQWQIMVYRDGLVTHYKTLDKERKTLRGGVYKPVREYALVYTPDDGLLEVISNSRDDRERLGRLFATSMLGITGKLAPIVPCRVNLDVFSQEPALDFSDDQPIEEDIERVLVSGITLQSIQTRGEIDIKPYLRTGDSMDVYQDLRLNDVPLLMQYAGQKIKRVKLSIVFRASHDGRLRKETHHFTLTVPNKCSLKPHDDRRRYIREVLLPRWGVFTEERAL
ncbi:MAG: hypothetical protein B0D91_14465 [Oceanospirillales bacterium LUC14_002_19_P2]|nr:MAG: hypothetical protein B0D91_14465 [Oceanospirillales bacterium LUC14_002_19_P2]